MRKIPLISLITVLCCVGPLAAQAETVNLFQDGASERPAGYTYTSIFDGNLLFTPGVDTISNVSLNLVFTEGDALALTQTESVLTNSTSFFGVPWVTYDTIHTFTDPLDSVRVLIGRAGGQTALINNAAGHYQTEEVISTSLPQVVLDNPAYLDLLTDVDVGGEIVLSSLGQSLVDLGGLSREVRRTTGFGGDFSTQILLDAESLSLFATTGLLRFGYTVTGGRVALDSATLSFDINATPVPIPAVWPLMALTLGVLASRRRTACA